MTTAHIVAVPKLGALDYEVVERKGIGHPDTMADALAERLSRVYFNYTLREYGAILHHGFDKLAILGGKTEVAFGEGRLVKPVRELVKYYHAQWSAYVQLQESCERASDIIVRELDRNANLRLNEALRDEQPFDLPHEAYLEKLVAKDNLNISRLRQLFGENRH